MNGPEILRKNMDRLRTRMGACFLGKRAVFRGRDLHADLKHIEWIDLYIFGITGRRFTATQLKMLNAMWVYTSYPDARIWNNRVAALAGTVRSTGNLGVSASLAISEAFIYGRGVDLRAIDFLINTRKALDNGNELAECIIKELRNHRRIAGYGRPLKSGDERILPTMELARTLDLDNGEHVRIAFEVEKFLMIGRWRMQMNIGALFAALAADLGLNAREYYAFMYPAFLAGMQPCYIEATERPEGILFPLSCPHIIYEGQPKRKWQQK